MTFTSNFKDREHTASTTRRASVLLATMLFLILCSLSVFSYTIEDDTVYDENQYVKVSVTPHTREPFEMQRVEVSSKDTAGDLCMALIFDHKIEKSDVTLPSGALKKFDYVLMGEDHVYYTEDKVNFGINQTRGFSIDYIPNTPDGKFDVIVTAPKAANTCKESAQSPSNRHFAMRLDPWWNTTWNTCRNLTYDFSSHVSSVGYNQTALFYITDKTDFNADLSDLRVIDAPCDEGGNLIPHDIERNAVSNASIWILAPIIGDVQANYSFYYNNSGASSVEDRAEVWRDYIQVFHLNETGAGSKEVEDSAVTNNGNFTTGGNSALGAVGIVHGAVDFDSDGFVETEYSPGNYADDAHTVSMWFKRQTTSGIQRLFDLGGTDFNQRYHSAYLFDGNANKVTTQTRLPGTILGVDSAQGYVDSEWHHIVSTVDANGRPTLYMDGFYQGNNTGGPLTLTGFQRGFFGAFWNGGSLQNYFDGTADELRIYNGSMSLDQAKIEVNNLLNYSTTVTINPTQQQTPAVLTSLLVLDVTPTSDFTFSSPTFVEASRTAFNLTTARNMTFIGSMNIQKTFPFFTNDVSIRIDLDDVPVHEEVLRTVTGTSIGSAGIAPFLVDIPAGEHNISILYARTSFTGIEISNQNIGAYVAESDDANPVRINVTSANYSLSSATFSEEFTWEIAKAFSPSDTYILTKQTVSGTVASDYDAYINDTEDMTISPYWSRYVSSGTDIGSTMGVWLDEDEDGDHTHAIHARNTLGSVDVTSSILDMDMADSAGGIISARGESDPLTDLSSSRTLTSGTTTILNFTHTHQAGDSITLSSQISAESNSGTQEPTFTMSADASDCVSSQDRTFGASVQAGNIMQFLGCPAIVGTTYNVSLAITVDVGESLEILDESLTVFDCTFLSGEEANTAPFFNEDVPDFQLFVNVTYTEDLDFMGNWTDLQADEAGISTNCSFLSTGIDNSTSTYSINYTSALSELGNNSCTVTITDTGGLFSTSNTFLVEVLESIAPDPPQPGDAPAVTPSLYQIGACDTGNTGTSIFLVGSMAIIVVLFIFLMTQNVPIIDGLFGLIIAFAGWYFIACINLIGILIIMMGVVLVAKAILNVFVLW